MNHLKQIAARLPEYGLDAMLLNSEPGEYYAVGFHGEGNVVVTAQGCFYFTDSRYIEAANHLITGAEIAMTGRSRNYRAMVQEVVDRCRIRKLGFEEGYLSVADYNLWKEGLTAELVPAQKLVDALRAAKDDGEIALMTKAQEITDRAFSEILKFIQPGMTEQEIAAKLQYDMLRFGAEKMSFDPIVVSGPNGSLPHGIPSAKQVQQGEFITMDFGCKYGGYCSDMTRTVALGEPTGEMRKVYQTVLEAQLAGIAVTKAGVPGKSIDAAARTTGRTGADITLVAATKMNDAARVREAVAAGIDACGENRVQEMTEKLAQGAYTGAPLHFIGHLQTNKVRQVVGKVDLIQSVDSPELLAMIEKRAAGQGIVQDILLEVNIGGEAAKSGVAPAALPELLETAAGCAHIRVRGLMAIPPVAETSDGNHAYFAKMHELFVDIGRKKYDNVFMDFLSMGMSGDFEDAISAGANMVRVGSSIFGARDYSRH